MKMINQLRMPIQKKKIPTKFLKLNVRVLSTLSEM